MIPGPTVSFCRAFSGRKGELFFWGVVWEAKTSPGCFNVNGFARQVDDQNNGETVYVLLYTWKFKHDLEHLRKETGNEEDVCIDYDNWDSDDNVWM